MSSGHHQPNLHIHIFWLALNNGSGLKCVALSNMSVITMGSGLHCTRNELNQYVFLSSFALNVEKKYVQSILDAKSFSMDMVHTYRCEVLN